MKLLLVLLACIVALIASAGMVTIAVTPIAPTPEPKPAVDELRAAADLASVTAFSNTLGAQAGQVDRLVDATISQVATWQALAVILVVALVAALLGAVAVAGVVALRVTHRRPAAPVYYMVQPQAPQVGAPAAHMILDDPDQWPELRARRRALAELAAPREGREGDER